MKRRDFIKNSALASSLFFVPGFIRASDSGIFTNNSFKRLVVIQLAGGNDGLNSVVPFRNDIYYRNRPTLGVKRKDVLSINGELGFHKNLKPLKRLFDAGELSVINNVGYPNPDRSHFRSTDIWHTASASNEVLTEGWIGRYLDHYGKHPHETIEIGNSLSLVMKGAERSGIVTENAGLLHKISRDPFFDYVLKNNSDKHLSEHNMGYLYQTMIDAKQSAKYIYEKSKVYQSRSDYGKSKFGKQLKSIAEFINSGLETKIFYASLGGFDTHAGQKGRQEKLMKTYAEAVEVLVKDLKDQNTFEDTLILTFSEFGRRVAENAALGTDHGAANNVFVIGSKLKKPGLFNAAPDLKNLDGNGDLQYEVDFRSIYANLLEDWLMVDKNKILSGNINSIGIV
ncbi:MAG: DUF1501 domain-containing protein [Flavobacteriaceae bacterium]|nr:DUF1501 domain-containing protein [Flavobacteriaceae bacterium]